VAEAPTRAVAAAGVARLAAAARPGRRRPQRPRLEARLGARLHAGFEAGLARGVGLDLADRFFEPKPLPRDIGFRERRVHAAQLGDQRRAGPLVERAARLAGAFAKPLDGTRYERLIVGHGFSLRRDGENFIAYVSNGFCIRMVSSRSGLVDSSAAEQPINSSMRRTYLMAWAGSSAHERARAVFSPQPAMVS